MSDSETPWTAARQSSLSITNSQSLLKLMSIKSVMPSNHLILSRPLLLLPSMFPSFRVFSSESVLHIRWPKYWSFSFSIGPSTEYSELISFRIDWLDLLTVQENSWLSGEELICQSRRHGFDPWVGRFPGEEHGNPFQYSCLGNPVDRGAWWATVHGVAKELDMT